eukprot:11176733-Lingulodinium_polyedra.AAC.1
MGGPLTAEPDAKKAARAAEVLEAEGVCVDKEGEASATEEARSEIQQAAWIEEDVASRGDRQAAGKGPTHRLLGRTMRVLTQVRAARRWLAAGRAEQERRPAAGGPGTGGLWTAPPDGALLPNAHWRAATQ